MKRSLKKNLGLLNFISRRLDSSAILTRGNKFLTVRLLSFISLDMGFWVCQFSLEMEGDWVFGHVEFFILGKRNTANCLNL
ncbi:unnamed protein product [Rhizophagus irregularis]|uniref:Uncharacterized protein n=1 Tax=Rhizophagus irregularis TaxID=588596 RepID=A0A916E9T4_9GLOM|nr:unnamed protein product [Rhizophagus irregularis]